MYKGIRIMCYTYIFSHYIECWM